MLLCFQTLSNHLHSAALSSPSVSQPCCNLLQTRQLAPIHPTLKSSFSARPALGGIVIRPPSWDWGGFVSGWRIIIPHVYCSHMDGCVHRSSSH